MELRLHENDPVQQLLHHFVLASVVGLRDFLAFDFCLLIYGDLGTLGAPSVLKGWRVRGDESITQRSELTDASNDLNCCSFCLRYSSISFMA